MVLVAYASALVLGWRVNVLVLIATVLLTSLEMMMMKMMKKMKLTCMLLLVTVDVNTK